MSHKKILIIDDEEDLCLLLKEYFLRRNYDVTISHHLAEGKELLPIVMPDAVVLDNNLPGGTGWNMASYIASNYPDTYMLLISAYNPSLPPLPDGARYNTIEKPISFAALDTYFPVL